jgi:transposase
MAKSNGQQRERRAFTAEFKLEAVRRVAERRAAGASLRQVARELDVRDDLLRKWARQATERAGAPPADVFPGNGRLPSEADEVRRLQRELARAQQEIAFLKSAAAYFARESR